MANVLKKYFDNNHSNVFRIGGDEFSIIIDNVEKESKENIERKCIAMNEDLKGVKHSVPPVSLSIGIAYGNEEDTTDSLFRKADNALYFVKQNGRAGYYFYEEK